MALYAFINQQQYKALWDFEISEQSGNKTSTSISVLVEDQPIPVSGDIIELVDVTDTGNTTLFWGVCGIPKSPKYETGLEARVYDITCGNANTILSYRIANVAYQGYTITQIIQALFNTYIQAEGISLGLISNMDLVLDVYTAANMNLQDVLNELADYVGAVWEIRPDRKFYFLAPVDFPQFPQTMDMGFFFGGGLQSTTKDYKQRTVQYISGATDYTSTQVETFTYDGEQQSFTLSFPLASAPAISVNGAPVPADLIGVSGLSDGDQNVVFVWAYNSQTVSYKEGTKYLNTGDAVVFTYTGIFPIRVVVTNDAKIAEIAALTGTSGRREMVQLANNVTTQADAVTLANSLLQQFESYTGEVKFFIFSDQLAALGMTLQDVEILTQMTFDLPGLGITGNYVIVERKLTPAYADMSNAENKLQVDLRLVNRDYVKSYGECISDLRRDINQLSIRADDLVVNVQSVRERETLSEQIQTSFGPALYATASLQNGSLFAPLDFGLLAYPSA